VFNLDTDKVIKLKKRNGTHGNLSKPIKSSLIRECSDTVLTGDGVGPGKLF
jgi:hypothetical protein